MPRQPKIPAFMGSHFAKSPKGSFAAIFGAPHGTPYKTIDNRVHATAAKTIRSALKDDIAWVDHYHWGLGGKLIPRDDIKAVDLGDLPTKPKDGRGNRTKIQTTTRSILDAGAVPIMIGGDDSTPIPFLQAFENSSALTILQIDAHIDWRHEREREIWGFSSTMRRASEMDHVWRIVQVGARGIGSARQEEVDDARNWGVHFITSRDIHGRGISQVLDFIEVDSDVVICLDLDALDSSVMPAVAYPSPGGLNFVQLTSLIAAVADKARIAGFAMVEFVPKRDLNGTAAFTAAKIASRTLGHIARQVKGQAK